MGTRQVRFGPIEAVEDSVFVGDVRAGREFLELTPAGVRSCVSGKPTDFVPWHRFFEIGLGITTIRSRRPKVMAKVTAAVMMRAPSGAPGLDDGGCWLSGTLRRPYVFWAGEFTPHRRGYPYRVRSLAEALVGVLAKEKRVAALGDADWMRICLAELAMLRASVWRWSRTLVGELLEQHPPPR